LHAINRINFFLSNIKKRAEGKARPSHGRKREEREREKEEFQN